ncbi:MAG: hypothetical protein WA417_14640 [Stellaceae bacterium]
MGWLYQREPVDDLVAYLTAKYNYDCDTHALQTLDGARVGNTVYLAVKSTIKETGRSFVFAGVILISNTKKHGFGYKDMSESMGPWECACPDRIIHLLSPISDIPNPSYSADWRARVAARKVEQRQRRERRRSLRVGSTVTLPTPIRFPGGDTASTFLVARFHRKTPIFVSLDGPEFSCRLRAATLDAATITHPQNSDSAPPAVPAWPSADACDG